MSKKAGSFKFVSALILTTNLFGITFTAAADPSTEGNDGSQYYQAKFLSLNLVNGKITSKVSNAISSFGPNKPSSFSYQATSGNRYDLQLNNEKFGDSSGKRITEVSSFKGISGRTSTLNEDYSLRSTTNCTPMIGEAGSLACVTATKKLCAGVMKEVMNLEKSGAMQADAEANAKKLGECSALLGNYSKIAMAADSQINSDTHYNEVVKQDLSEIEASIKASNPKNGVPKLNGMKIDSLFGGLTLKNAFDSAKATQQGLANASFASLIKLVDTCRDHYDDFKYSTGTSVNKKKSELQ